MSFRKGNRPERVLAPPTAAKIFNNHLREIEAIVSM
jgi:hypothetical protein